MELEPDLRVTGETGDGREVLGLIAETKPEVAVIDLRLSGSSGLELLGDIARADKNIRIVVLATVDDKEVIREVFRLGARGVVLRESAAKVLIQSIRGVIEGKYWVGERLVEALDQELQGFLQPAGEDLRPRTFGLTKRELEVVATVVSGYSNREIAKRLMISEDTVKHHVTNIFDKLGVYNRLELALFAIHHGLVGRRQ